MIRYVAPSPEAAQALMDGTSTLLVVDSGYWPRGFVTDEDHPPVPPADYVRATTSGERIGIYVTCEPDDYEDGWHIWDRGSTQLHIHSETGDRIIYAAPEWAPRRCTTCGGRRRFDGSVAGDHVKLIQHGASCPDCNPGLVLVGSVLAVEVLPIVNGLGSLGDPLPRIGVVVGTLRNDGMYLMRAWVYPSEPITHELAYHDPASLPGKYGVLATDARRATP